MNARCRARNAPAAPPEGEPRRRPENEEVTGYVVVSVVTASREQELTQVLRGLQAGGSTGPGRPPEAARGSGPYRTHLPTT